MRQALSWILSILFHATVALALFHSVDLPTFEPEEILQVDLTEMESPDIITQFPPIQPKPEQTPDPAEPEIPMTAAAPLPMDKTIVLDDAPPAPTPPPSRKPLPSQNPM